MKVVAVVVSWNAATQLPACLARLDAQDHDDLEVVVVDNASTDVTARILAEAETRPWRHPLRIVRNHTNRGFAGAINDGLAVSDGDAVLFCNVDIEPDPSLVSRCVAVLEQDERIGSVQPKLLRTVAAPDGAPVIDTTGHVLTSARLVRNRGEGERDLGQYEQAGEVFGASGALVLHRRVMLDDVAWRGDDGRREVLTEDLFAYFDDVELDWRARLLGWRAWYEPTAVGRHERGGAGVRRTPLVEALNYANRLVVVATCDDLAALVRAAPVVVATTALKTIELAVTVPSALVPAARRLALLPGARRRRRQVLARSRVSTGEVVARWVEPFRWRPWIGTWWRRVTGRALGVAR
ncbi:glycosyltransferase [Egicoccus sp. AB-alg6-2]|uniref:glycosyltransferase n=1 Tax=Egicoccus sp. AB-alg6-2 TaxID=3242692 RepID=UPI00359E01FD